jgi:hypothetical protein
VWFPAAAFSGTDIVALRVDAVKFGSIPDETVPSNVRNH